ncbi:hypothetical protein MT325_m046R [Paramecium bursaria chlorella virus MT325]|uniref:Uncharacterized protein m046R n=1 Tax=Paramecium bursaria Chlorella virus MT325 TaxID=346932 RepID=A7ITC6_PBCVM|nr:hypothetical protein MT325_m046R [Paramecium bursaria chlorella virus MT325]
MAYIFISIAPAIRNDSYADATAEHGHSFHDSSRRRVTISRKRLGFFEWRLAGNVPTYGVFGIFRSE